MLRKSFRTGLLILFWLLPRTLGAETAEEAARRAELIRVLNEEGIPLEIRPLYGGYGGFGSSVHVTIPPDSPAGGPDGPSAAGTLVLGVPLSPRGAAGGGLPYNVKAAVHYLKKIRAGGTEVRVLAAFLGDEFSRLPRDEQRDIHLGFKDLLTQVENPENSRLLYLDLAGSPGGLRIHHGGAGFIMPLNTLRPFTEACALGEVPYAFQVRFNELYKLRLEDGPAVLDAARNEELPGLYLEGFSGGGPPVSPESLGDLLAAYGSSADFQDTDWDTHYTIVPYGGKTVFIDELTLVVTLLVFSALFLFLLLIYSIIFRRILIIQWKLFIRRSWVLLLLFALLFAAFQVSRLFLSFALRQFAAESSRMGYGGVGIQFGITALLFLLASRLCDPIPIPRRANFYGNAAIMTLVPGIVISAALDITFVPLLIWTFIWAFAASAVRIPPLVWLCALLMPAQNLAAVRNSVETGNAGFTSLILSRNIPVSLYITVIILPVFLILKRGMALIRRGRARHLAPYGIYLILLAAAIPGSLVYGRHLAKTGPPPPVRRTLAGKTPETEIAELVLLERRILTVTVKAPGTPVRIDMYADAGRAMPAIYDAPMPFEYTREGNSVRFILGEGPPNPLTAELVFPLDFSGSLRVEAVYAAWDGGIDPLPPPGTEDYVLRLVTTIPLGALPARPQDPVFSVPGATSGAP
jgi:hypothetical protein